MKEFKLAGGEFKLQLAPFDQAKELYQAILEEGRAMKIHGDLEMDHNFYKDLFCMGFSSKKVEACIWACLNSCLYNGVRVSKDTFESESARGDYMEICFIVIRENVSPFTKGLFARLNGLVESLKGILNT